MIRLQYLPIGDDTLQNHRDRARIRLER